MYESTCTLLTLGACAAGLRWSLCVCVCLSITKLLLLHTSFASPKCSVIRFLIAFQRRDLCGFLRKRFVCQFWASFADSKLLDFARASDSMTLRVNRTLCVGCYIRYVRLLTLGACALGTVAKIINPGHHCRLPCSVHWQAFDDCGMTVASFQL